MTKRVLVIGHGHPDRISGGGEIAAYKCWQAYEQNTDVEDACLLARGTHEHSGLGGAVSGRLLQYRQNQYIWDQALADPFMMRAANLHEVVGHFAEFLTAWKPTLIHTHHYFMLGLEYLKVIKDVLPDCRTIMTLHEYMAICPNSGTMTRPESGTLCRSGAYDQHFDCAPDRTREDHWLRYNRFQTYFAFVDHFIAPSQFLRDLYVEWGIAPERISVIPNGADYQQLLPPRPLGPDETRNRFAFFGQINPLKGVDVVLKALHTLSPEQRRKLVFEIHGANLDRQADGFRKSIRKLIKPLEKDGSVRVVGPYTQSELPSRMAAVDWVVVPSVWYENAPLVIQEAFGLGRPVITTDLGGMREAVRHEVDGICLPRGHIHDMASTLLRLSQDTTTFERFVENLPTPITWETCVARHLDLASTHDLAMT